MMRRAVPLFATLACLVVLPAPVIPAMQPQPGPDTIDWAAVHDITARGIDRFYRLDNPGAMQHFDSVARMAPGDPRGYFFRSMVHFSLYALDRDRKHFDAFMKESEKVISVCERLLDHDGHDSNAKFYLGGIYGYRGMAWQTEGSLVTAVKEGREGYTLLEEAVEEKPDLYDAQMGFGLFRYLVAKAPRSLHWMLKLLGITPDLEGGLRMLQSAADRGTYTRNEARLYLAQFLFTENRHDEAFEQLNLLCTQFPENTLFLILRASWNQRTGKPDEAMADALRAVELNKRRPIHYVEDLASSTLGGLYYARNDFARSRQYYARYIDSLKSPERVWNWTWYRIGVAHELAGDREAAVAIFSRMRKSTDALRPNDAYYLRRASEHLRRPITAAEALVIRGGNEAGSKNFAQALRYFHEALEAPDADVEIRSRAWLGILQTQYDMNDDSAVVTSSRSLFALKPDRELWTLPHGYYTLGQAYARLGMKKEAAGAFDMIDEFDDYDFQDRLESRVEAEQRKLAGAGN